MLGWPAHRTCAEWLGDWKPSPPPFRPDPDLTGYAERGQKGTVSITVTSSPGAQVNVGGGAGGSGQTVIAFASPETPDITEQVAAGLITADEARLRLNAEIFALWGVPPALLEDHTHKVGDPIPIERCPWCGAQFAGTPDYLRGAYRMHRQRGCRA